MKGISHLHKNSPYIKLLGNLVDVKIVKLQVYCISNVTCLLAFPRQMQERVLHELNAEKAHYVCVSFLIFTV